MNTALNRAAACGGSTCRGAKVEKPLHHEVRRRGNEVIERAR
jgi:hypothetical protein